MFLRASPQGKPGFLLVMIPVYPSLITSFFRSDSDLEAFSHNPQNGSFEALANQQTPLP
jgi:hypothetical protein